MTDGAGPSVPASFQTKSGALGLRGKVVLPHKVGAPGLASETWESRRPVTPN
jgi:hypothetical protein